MTNDGYRLAIIIKIQKYPNKTNMQIFATRNMNIYKHFTKTSFGISIKNTPIYMNFN